MQSFSAGPWYIKICNVSFPVHHELQNIGVAFFRNYKKGGHTEIRA